METQTMPVVHWVLQPLPGQSMPLVQATGWARSKSRRHGSAHQSPSMPRARASGSGCQMTTVCCTQRQPLRLRARNRRGPCLLWGGRSFQPRMTCVCSSPHHPWRWLWHCNRRARDSLLPTWPCMSRACRTAMSTQTRMMACSRVLPPCQTRTANGMLQPLLRRWAQSRRHES